MRSLYPLTKPYYYYEIEDGKIGGACGEQGRDEKFTEFLWKNLNERNCSV
jgi:hypothetical protein